jgi:hypothetical protein
MKRAAVILIPAALFTAAMWVIVRGIDVQVAQENSNHAIARLMECEYQGRLDRVPEVLVFRCSSGIELHEEIKW